VGLILLCSCPAAPRWEESKLSSASHLSDARIPYFEPLNSKPQTLNPTPQTPKLESRKPKTSTKQAGGGDGAREWSEEGARGASLRDYAQHPEQYAPSPHSQTLTRKPQTLKQ